MAQKYTPINKREEGITVADREAAQRIANSLLRRYRHTGLHRLADDIANRALKELAVAMSRGHIRNHEAFMTWKIRLLITDAGRRQVVEENRLKIWVEEMEVLKSKRVDDDYLVGRGGKLPSGLSTDLASREEREMVNLIGWAIVEIMPDPIDRAILSDRLTGDFPTITELARKYGKTPNSMANYLKKLLGSEDEPGAVAPVGEVLRQLPMKTAIQFVREISRLDSTESIADPSDAAIVHLELAGTNSRAHKQQAARGAAHLRWLQQNQPSNRGINNKILNRLIRAACFYVIEPNDARHDTKSELGLHDDVSVLAAVQKVVRKYSK